MNICVICSGNICRSPFAEYILKRESKNKNYNIYSAGTLNIYGEKAYNECIKLAPCYNINLQSHLSQGIDREIIEKTDIFLVMTKKHKNLLIKKYKIAPSKIILLSNYLKTDKVYDCGIFGKIIKGNDIPDPMGGDSNIVKPILDIIEEACINFMKTLKNKIK